MIVTKDRGEASYMEKGLGNSPRRKRNDEATKNDATYKLLEVLEEALCGVAELWWSIISGDFQQALVVGQNSSFSKE